MYGLLSVKMCYGAMGIDVQYVEVEGHCRWII